ncbi:TetR/AcrR family transcriptional regulator [Pseudonocardia sp. GCM10023141]|uniref:TetR/AcrR family transcriptional regulator n=1 Tax=Pseudonocardia sp. GCM10023141 TaxID=3252653 RepID=UPI00361DA3FF
MRPTSEQIDRVILDAAAHAFAVHGFARTSVQQVADAVDYSKTGLLHRFPSKQALYDATVEATRLVVEQVLATAAATPAGTARTVAMLDAVGRLTQDRPGLVELLLESTRPGCVDPAREELNGLVVRVIETLAGAVDSAEHRLRTVLALRLIVDAVLSQDHEEVRLDCEHLQRLIVELAAGVLGLDPALHTPTRPVGETS